MSKTDNIFLIGPMGAGKSSIGRKLSSKLTRPFWDSDKVLEQRTGVDIATIFEFEGEAGFRERESRVIDELSRQAGIVLATGGGAVLLTHNRDWLQMRGLVVYLCATVNTQLRRTARNRNRPLLYDTDPRAKLSRLFDQRDPLYRQIADIVVSTDNLSIPIVTDALLRQLESPGACRKNICRFES
ncbi:MAG: shikimate kinase AroK [Gammaproteobacteria bacterium]|nr:shikimate kinase AroK [Gammaproteobacteria bacterium]